MDGRSPARVSESPMNYWLWWPILRLKIRKWFRIESDNCFQSSFTREHVMSQQRNQRKIPPHVNSRETSKINAWQFYHLSIFQKRYWFSWLIIIMLQRFRCSLRSFEWFRAQENQSGNLIRPWLRSKCPPFSVGSPSSQHSFWYSYRNHRHVDHFQQKIYEKGVWTWATKATSLNPTAPAKDEWHFPRYLHNVLIIVFVLVCCFILCNYFWHTLK